MKYGATFSALACLVFMFGLSLAAKIPAVYADDPSVEPCIPNPFPPDFWILHKDWQKLHLLPCSDQDRGHKTSPTPTPTPGPQPSVTPAPTSAPGNPPGSTGGSTSGAGSASGTSASCTDPAPATAPQLLSVSDLGGGKMQLKWSAVNPVTHYALAFGPGSKNYLYGQTNIGNTTDYIVASLERGKSYCFAVSAVNGCTASGFSNELCSGQVLGVSSGVGQVLGLSNTSSDETKTKTAFAFLGLLCISSGLYLRKAKVN